MQAEGWGRSSHRYQSSRDPQKLLRARLKELAAGRMRSNGVWVMDFMSDRLADERSAGS